MHKKDRNKSLTSKAMLLHPYSWPSLPCCVTAQSGFEDVAKNNALGGHQLVSLCFVTVVSTLFWV